MKQSHCQKCGLALSWKQIDTKKGKKWCPTNPDGSDHWDICRATQFLNAGKQVKVGELTFMTVPTGKAPPAYSGELPPWDESLVPDWSWVRGSKTIRAKNAYQKHVDPQEIIARLT